MDYNKLLKTKPEKNIQEILENPFKNIPTLTEAIEISEKYKLDLHPKYIYYWNELSSNEFITFLEHLKKAKTTFEKNTLKQIILPKTKEKKYYEVLGIEHNIGKQPIEQIKSEEEANIIIINELNSLMLLTNLGIDITKKENIQSNLNELQKQIKKLIEYTTQNLEKTTLEIINKHTKIRIRDKAGTYIGARMGRPEKAKMRKQFNDETRSHGLFPVGTEGGRSKNIVEVLKNVGEINEQFRTFLCEKCNHKTIYHKCEKCNEPTKQLFFEKYTYKPLEKESETSLFYEKKKLDTNTIDQQLRNILGKTTQYPKAVKGITATINKHHTVEHISKGFLRALNNVFVNKDGTVRFDMIEMGLTHFKPKEIGTSIKKLKEIGYTHDYQGKPLTNDNQTIEILPQDVILPDCIESGDELASDYIINTGNFVDDLLEKLYKLPRFYNFKTKEDTIGHLIIGLAPHTSAGIVGRIIGYSKTQGCFSHPVWHAAQRRNLDGDENGIMLLVDGLINFSREYLPDRRGSRTMDVSLVLTSHLYLDQIDDEVHGMDIVDHYPLEFYQANKNYVSPKSIKIEKVDARLEIEEYDNRYLNYGFTHTTDDMNNTILCSSYKSVPSMTEKLDLQLGLGEKLRAVDQDKVGTFVIDKHFMKDIKGNLRKFSMQTFRCTNCNTKFRRPPLVGKCTNCGNASVNFTIHEGSIKKYINPSFQIIEKYNVDPYIVESIELVNQRIEGVFGEEKEKQKDLNAFFGK